MGLSLGFSKSGRSALLMGVDWTVIDPRVAIGDGLDISKGDVEGAVEESVSTPEEEEDNSTMGIESSLKESFSIVNLVERLTSRDSAGVLLGVEGVTVSDLEPNLSLTGFFLGGERTSTDVSNSLSLFLAASCCCNT